VALRVNGESLPSGRILDDIVQAPPVSQGPVICSRARKTCGKQLRAAIQLDLMTERADPD
jgi:hypothetical protein